MKNNIIGIDIGYGYTKVCNGTQLIVFPSRVSRMRARGAFDAPDNDIIVNGQTFVVGDDISTFGNYSVSREFVGTPEYLALLGRALTMVKNSYNILVLGLPPGLYDEKRIAALERLILTTTFRNNAGAVRVPKIIKFVPQGAGIYFDYLSQRKTSSDNNIIVIDIGYFTMDFVLFSQQRYIAGAARSYPLGISKLLNEIKAHFTKIHGLFLDNDDNVLKIIRDGEYSHFGKVYKLDITEQMDEYINQKILKAVGNYASELRESTNKSVDEIVIGGGGVNCIGQFAGQAIIIEDPQMSNARGYYQYGLHQVAENSSSRNKEENTTLQVCVSNE